MATVKGGKKCNLIQSWRKDWNSSYSMGQDHLLAQTFPIAADTHIASIFLATYAPVWKAPYFCDIRATDGAGKPFGPNLATKYLVVQDEVEGVPGTWKMFFYDDFPLLTPGQYAIVFNSPTAFTDNSIAWTSQLGLNRYRAGDAYLSEDNGLSWVKLDSRCFLFEVWGWQPPPDPPPEPAISNWAAIDLATEYTETTVTLAVTTDKPVHLYMRWTLTEPLKHPSEILRRGILIMAGTRWCFVSFHENEQEEDGDTLVHTFVKPDWPVCQTRWFYFIGQKQSIESPSASPIFHYHHVAPPPVEHMDELVSIEPQLHHLAVGGAWTEIDLKHELHPEATGFIFCLINTDAGAERHFGFRPKGSAFSWAPLMKRHTITWGLAPVDSDRIMEYFASFAGVGDLWIMGYTGRNVHFLDTPVDITAPYTGVWTVRDLAADAPGAIAVILDIGSIPGAVSAFGARCNGSTDNRIFGCYRAWPVIKCDATQKIELSQLDPAARTPKVYLSGYITANLTMETNAPMIGAGAAGNWVPLLINPTYPTPKFGFIEITSTTAWVDQGMRKRYSLRDIKYDGDNHNWAIVHCNATGYIEWWREFNVAIPYLHGLSH